ncbi:MAG: hypothetical protein M3126_02150 [Candidatus Eremiobacteraeota bacterium]|nr:hypothetical protein [Candidatus Eremiobacteraeota bacterium]
MIAQRFVATAVVIAAIAVMPHSAMAVEQTSAQTLGVSECMVVVVQTQQDVDSATAKPGQFFRFATINAVTAGANVVIPAKTPGWGVISVASAAGAHGVPGNLLLDPRFLLLSGERKLSVVLDHNASDLGKTGTSGNAPGILGALPVPAMGAAIGAFNYLHHGNNITVRKGTIFAIFPSDSPTTARCQKR